MLKLREVLLSEGEEEGKRSASPVISGSSTPTLSKSSFSPLFPKTVGSLPDLLDLSPTKQATRSPSFDFGEALKHINSPIVQKRQHKRNRKARNPKIRSANMPNISIFLSADESQDITSLEFGMLRLKQRSSSMDKVSKREREAVNLC